MHYEWFGKFYPVPTGLYFISYFPGKTLQLCKSLFLIFQKIEFPVHLSFDFLVNCNRVARFDFCSSDNLRTNPFPLFQLLPIKIPKPQPLPLQEALDEGSWYPSLTRLSLFPSRSRYNVLMNGLSEEALLHKSYACGPNSYRSDSTNDPGNLCNCNNGFEGNPYLPRVGCLDINECENRDSTFYHASDI
ncbi:uncharacterized protein LOC122064560 [Macadamia integrifolia]|uniref:uncharacterized protein LOC122064560 n=1 Tax=Macadamia integrifolia TaxID=60698 RepID=UPI001C4EDB72|nr:uncharacterized protein LOC122064560 [Macadamia integrifolia]